MASHFRNASTAVIRRLKDEPWRFDFFAAVLWLERLQQNQGTDASDVASSPLPNHESIRFQTQQQQVYSPSDLVKITASNRGNGESGWNITVGMMGLTGPNGVMPTHYSRLVIDQLRKSERAREPRDKDRESALPDFLNMFNHRQISLFYRAWKKYRLEALYSRPLDSKKSAGDDPMTTVLYSLIGLATGRQDRPQSLRKRNDFSDEILLFYSGAFSRWPRSAVTLRNIAAEMFRLPVEILEFQPQWSQLRPEDQFRLESGAGSLGKESALGQNVMIGSRICLFDTRFRIRLGPLNREQFDRLLPEGDRFCAVVQFIRLYVGAQWDFDIQLVLKAVDVPPTRLAGKNSFGSQLGRNSWALNRQAAINQDQVVLIPDELKVNVRHCNDSLNDT